MSLCWAKTVSQQFCWIRAYFCAKWGHCLFIWSQGSFTFLFRKLYTVLNYLIFSERNSMFLYPCYVRRVSLLKKKNNNNNKNKPMSATRNRLSYLVLLVWMLAQVPSLCFLDGCPLRLRVWGEGMMYHTISKTSYEVCLKSQNKRQNCYRNNRNSIVATILSYKKNWIAAFVST